MITLSMGVKLQANTNVLWGGSVDLGVLEWIPSRQNLQPTLWREKPGPLALRPRALPRGIQQEADNIGLSVFPQMAEAEAVQLKEEGNQHFQRQDYKAATKSYSQALKLTKDKALLATLYRNRAACGLKMVWGQDSMGVLRAVKAGGEVVMA